MVMIIIMTEESIFVVTLSKHLLAGPSPATSRRQAPYQCPEVSEIILTVNIVLSHCLSVSVSAGPTSVLHTGRVMINSPGSLSLISTHTTPHHTQHLTNYTTTNSHHRDIDYFPPHFTSHLSSPPAGPCRTNI